MASLTCSLGATAGSRHMSPGRHALDRRLLALRTAQHAVASEVQALEADATYVLLTGDRLTGVTAERARPALAAVEQVWRGLSLLDDLLSWIGAHQNRADVDDDTAARLMAHLNGPSIAIGAGPQPAVGGAPLLGSPTSPGQSLAPDALLAMLTHALTPTRQIVAEVDAARRELLPRLDRLTTEAHHLATELPGHRPLTELVAALDALRRHIMEDPLGAAEELTGLESALAGVAVARAELARLSKEVAGAARILAELEEVLAEGRDAFDRTRAEIANPDGLLEPVRPEVLHDEQRGLRPWLGRLERLVTEGDASRAKAGLASWRALADQTLAVARQVAEANARPWSRRRELHGLLRAARVKAGAVGRAEDPLVTELAVRAMRSLDVPCDLQAAATAIEELLEGLRRPPPSDTTGGATGSAADAVGPAGSIPTTQAAGDRDAGPAPGGTAGSSDHSGLAQPSPTTDEHARPVARPARAATADRRVGAPR
jgi:hypothetical protein